VLAGKTYDLPVAGTHAHSWVMSFPTEIDAFRSFVKLYPERCVLLVDTYDTVESGVPNAITVFRELHDAGKPVRPSIRLDSGDLAKLSKIAHSMMTEAGFENPLIVASNDLEEDLIADLKRQGAKINAWGVGTHLITSHDSPALNGVYKLVALNEDGTWQPRIKISSNPEKATDPGKKQLVRYYDADDHPIADVLYADDESWEDSSKIKVRNRLQPQVPARLKNAARAEALLVPVFEDGKKIPTGANVHDVRRYAKSQIDVIPEEYRRLRNPEVYRVLLSERVASVKESLLLDPELV
jgi:nicotinate phosphoribosyltransferase